MKLEELAAAQDLLNANIKTLVAEFVEETGAKLQNGNIQVYSDSTGNNIINVNTSVELLLDGARITRQSPTA